MKTIFHYPIKQFIRDLFSYIRPYRFQFLIGFILRLTSDISRLYPTWALSRIILILSQKPAEISSELVKIFVYWGVLTIHYSITHNLSKYLGYQVAEKASLDIYKDTLSHVFKLDFAWQEKENSGNKMKRIDRGSDGINTTIRRIFDVLIEVTVNIVGITIIFFTLEPLVSGSLVLFIVVYFLVGTCLLKRAMKQEQIVNKAGEDLGGITFEALNNIQTIKSLSIDRGVRRIVSKRIIPLIQKIRRRIFLYQSRGIVLLTFESVFGFIIVSVIVWGIFEDRYDIGFLVLFTGLFQRVSSSTRELTDVTQQLALSKIWVSRAMAILKTQPKIESPVKVSKQVAYNSQWKRLEVRNLQFAYKKKNALDNVSFTINRGEKVGIVGLSGAGKSTLFKLLLDLYENYQGKILFDKIPLKHIQRQSYIDHVAVVLQDTELFNMSLRENIEIAAVKGISSSSGLLEEVIQMARLNDVVEDLPYGANTMVGEKGIKLSGGQRQRVGIARALYRQSDILLLDEATSHLDAHSEKEIQKALQGLMHKFTTIVIAHRLSTIKAMDKIVVLEKGRVVERGSFVELLKKEGVFTRMWQDQKI